MEKAPQGKNVLNLSTAGKIARIGSAGTPLGIVRRAADTAANPFLDRQAQKFAKRRLQKNPQSAPKKKLQGISFWLIVGLGLIKDSLDVFLNLSVVFILLVIPLGFLISFSVFMYFYMSDVKMDTRKVATMVVGFALDIIPLLSIFPTFTITLFIIRYLENSNQKKSGFVSRLTSRTGASA